MDLLGKVAIVTGGAQGIGWACVENLTKAGATVVIFDLHVDEAKLKMKEKGIDGHVISVDISKKDEIDCAVTEVVEKYGKIDILINNAGIFKDNRLLTMTEEQWDAVLNVNLKGAFFMIQAVAPHMIEQKYGKIVNLSSVSYKGNFGQANYSASKAGLVSLTKTAAIELSPHVTVNCIAPGPIDTPLFRSMDPKGKEKFLNKVLMNRAGNPEEIAKAVFFYASDLSSYVTGTVLDVDGGMTQGLNLR